MARGPTSRRPRSNLTVIVPATGRPLTLGRCLAEIQAAEEPPEELIVIDKPAEDGPAAARNAGAQLAEGDVLVFVDADVLVHRDAFRRIRDAFHADPSLTAIFGSYDDDPEARDLISSFRNLLHHHVHQEGAGPATTFWAGLGAIRRDAFEEAGGFDACRYLVPSVEDVELGLRVSGTGGRIRLDPELQGKHLKSWTLVEMLRTDFARRGVPWAELMLEQRATSTALNLGWRHRLTATAALIVAGATLARRPRTAALALGAMLMLNRPFYALLARKRGSAAAAGGVALHAMHHLAGAAAVPTAAARYVSVAIERRCRR